MMTTTDCRSVLLTSVLACAAAGLLGCDRAATPPAGAGSSHAATSSSDLASDDELLKMLDDALDFTYEKRRLDVKDQAAWQIVHGALAFKRDFLVRADGKDVSAVDYVLADNPLGGWNLARGELLDEQRPPD